MRGSYVYVSVLAAAIALIAPALAQQPSRTVEREVTVKATAYCPCKTCNGRFSRKRTAWGTALSSRGVAVDPSKIPLGSKVYVPGRGWHRADDTGGGVKGRRIDIRVSSHAQALRYGKRRITIKVRAPPRS